MTAFVTFNNQEAYEVCLNHFETDYNWYGFPKFEDKGEKTSLKLLGVNLECTEAPEPSNVLWENL